jgi:hypothetical protein
LAPELEPLLEPEPPVVDSDDELEPVPVELDDEPDGVRELGALRPLDIVPLESVALPVAAPPREPLSLECEHPASASAPTKIGIAHSLFFIRHLLLSLSRRIGIRQSE